MPLLVLAICMALASAASAQYTSGIDTTIVDQAGGGLAGAAMTIVNQDTQVTQAAVSDNHGYVQILHLPPGNYRVEIKASGFNTWVQSDIVVAGNEIHRIYPKMVVGGLATTVQVQAEVQTVETSRSMVGRSLDQETIREAPLVGENLYASVATLAPGVTGSGLESGGGAASGAQGTNSYSAEPAFQINVAGQRQEANEYRVDGTNVNDSARDGVVTITPVPDTVEEMKITAVTFSADKGRYSGGLVEVYTKPGTNEFHGSLSEMHTDNALFARTEFQTSVPKYIRNDFGGAIGGPILKGKTFFFGSLFWMKSVLGQTQTLTVETPAFRDYVVQNFPDSLAAQFLQIAPPGASPTRDFQTVAQIQQSLPSLYAPPNLPANLVAVGVTSVSQSPINNGFQGHIRVDHSFNSDKDRIFYSLFRDTIDSGVADPRPTYSYVSPDASLLSTIDYVHTFSSSIVNEASVSYVRGIGSQPQKVPALPNVNITGVDDGFNQWGPSGWVFNNWLYHDVLSTVKSAHTIRVGIDVDRQQAFANFTNGLIRPDFQFANILDFAADHPFSQSGPALDVRTGALATGLYDRELMLYVAPFVQDDWKVTRRLTLNLGLRWDYFGHISTYQDATTPGSFFTPGSGNTFAEQVANGFMARRNGQAGDVTDNPVWRFAPRLGFAWDVFGNGSTSVRGGWGVFNNRVGSLSWGSLIETNLPDHANPFISIDQPGVTLANFSYQPSSTGGPEGFLPPPGITYQLDSRGGLIGTQTGVGGSDPHLKVPLVQDWMLSIQRSLANNIVIEADYFGTHSSDLYYQTDVNRFAGDLIQNSGTLTRLNPSFATVTYGQSIGIANTSLGSLSVKKRFRGGYSLQAVFTYGKSLDETSSNDNGVDGAENVFDAQDPRRNYGRSDFDVRKRFALDAVWEIPGLRSGAGRLITKGWTVSPILLLQSGQPFTVFTSASYPAGDYNADGFGYDVPNVPTFGSYVPTSRSNFLKGVFKASDFPVPAAGREGNLGRNTYDGPGLANVNLSLQRSFAVPLFGREGTFQIRGVFLNLFNRVNLARPDGDLSSGTFGMSTDQILPRQIQVSAHLKF